MISPPKSTMALEEREFDLIIYGATGVTGSNCAEYLVASPSNSLLKWAIAGRNQLKLEKVQQELLKINPQSSIPIALAEHNFESLSILAKKTKVLVSTVGPFIRLGEPVVRACVKEGTHYVDSTGETGFIADIIEKYHEEAKTNKTLIIPSCGFDSVPSDLGAFLLAHHFNSKYNQETQSIHLAVKWLKGSVSGGTIHSALAMFDVPRKEMLKASSRNAIVCKSVQPTNRRNHGPFLKYNEVLKNWQSFYIMEVPNISYVLRSNSLFKNKYGSKFEYTEGFSQNFLVTALFMNFCVAFAGFCLLFPWNRTLVKWLVPQGSGPDSETVKKGGFEIDLVGISESNSHKALCKVIGVSDPGYGETCKMVIESALCIILDHRQLPENVSKGSDFPKIEGGVVTAASALGLVLAERLRKAGMTFAVREIE